MLRFEFDRRKSNLVKRKHGVSFQEAQEIFDQVYVVDQKRDDPQQFRAIGWCGGRLCSVIFEIRHDARSSSFRSIPGVRSTFTRLTGFTTVNLLVK